MKKFVVFIVVFAICFAFTACRITVDVNKPTKGTEIGDPTTSEVNATEIGDPTTSETKTTEIGDPTLATIPNADEYPEMTWPTFGIATKIPKPDWSNCGTIYIDTERWFWCDVGYSTLDNFNDYVKLCQEAGYNLNTVCKNGYFFYGEDEERRGLQIMYNEWGHSIGIEVQIETADMQKWWNG